MNDDEEFIDTRAERWKALAYQLLLSGDFAQKDYDLLIIDINNWREGKRNAIHDLHIQNRRDYGEQGSEKETSP
jgi:hypothetical protein